MAETKADAAIVEAPRGDIYVELVDSMGTDLTVVNAARVSLDKHTDVMRPADHKLIDFLAHEAHTSPFRHVFFTFRITAPEFVARQAYKHVVGISCTSGPCPTVDHGWNEVSMRYVRMKEFYRPPEWRKAPEEVRQGSSLTQHFDEQEQQQLHKIYEESVQFAQQQYQKLLNAGVAREMARMVLPLSVQTSWYWTLSLQAVAHFVKLRRHPGAQLEIQRLAEQIAVLVQQKCPVAWEALMKSPHV